MLFHYALITEAFHFYLFIYFLFVFLLFPKNRKAVRATGILIPLLGLQFLVFIKRPNDKDSTLYDVYAYAVAIVVSLQVCIFQAMNCDIKIYMPRRYLINFPRKGFFNMQRICIYGEIENPTNGVKRTFFLLIKNEPGG